MPRHSVTAINVAPAMKVAVFGAGSTGITLAKRLSASNCEVSMVEGGGSLSSIQGNRLIAPGAPDMNNTSIFVGSAEEINRPDMLFFCVKAADLISAALAARPLIDRNVVVVPVLNGVPWWYFSKEGSYLEGRHIRSVDPEGLLLKLFPAEQVIGAVTSVAAKRYDSECARTDLALEMTIGELDHHISPRVKTIALTLNNAGIPTTPSACIRDPIWTRLIQNLMTGPLSILSRATIGEICRSRHLSGIARDIVCEAFLVAAAYGARIGLDPQHLMDFTADAGDFKTPMLQDFEHGAEIELQSICRAVIELATLKGIAMPVTTMIVDLAAYLASQRIET